MTHNGSYVGALMEEVQAIATEKAIQRGISELYSTYSFFESYEHEQIQLGSRVAELSVTPFSQAPGST